ncbi:MAG: efflux transporter outer membrane subunit [Akkermansiaceae bacterium]|nr:efflux transporter outer membrane subunit [Akkermansiaceae bacterium]
MKPHISRFLPRFNARWRTVLPLIAVVATGCQTMSPRARSMDAVKLPASWKTGAGFSQATVSVDLSKWWGEFHDPVLTALIRESIESSPSLKSAHSVVRESRARRSSEGSALLPTLTGGLGSSDGWTRSDSATGAAVSDHTKLYSAGLNASWEVDLFGKQKASVAAAGADLSEAEETLRSVQASLASEVALAYLNLRAAESRLAVVRENVKILESTLELASWREQAGQGDALDAQRAKSNVEQVRSSIPTLEQAIESAKNSLALLAGKSPGALDDLLAKRTGKLPEPPRKLAVGIPADTMRQRPDVRGAGYAWLAAVYRTHSAEAARMPSLSLNGSLGVDSSVASHLLNPERVAANVIAGLTSPIFDGGKIRSQIAIQSEQQEQALQNYRKQVLTALSEVQDALVACQKNEERAAITAKALAAARDAEQLARQRYEAGVVDITTVLDTQQSRLSLQEQAVTVRADRSSSFVALYKALGGGWKK